MSIASSQPFRSLAPALIAAVLAGGLAGCGGGPAGGSGGTAGGGLGGFFSPPATAVAADDTPKLDTCPPVDIRSGAASHRVVGAAGPDGQQLRYQAIIGETARECVLAGQTVRMKVGVEGRLLAGPAGTGAPVDVPLRIAVVREGPTPRPIVSKFYRIPVQIPQGQLQVSFVHVEEDLSFPLPAGTDIENYIVYVGFDPNPPPPEKPQQKPRRSARTG